MMETFIAAIAVVMFLSGAGIDRINERKTNNQQAQPAQITYVGRANIVYIVTILLLTRGKLYIYSCFFTIWFYMVVACIYMNFALPRNL